MKIFNFSRSSRSLIFIGFILFFTGCDEFYKTEQIKVKIIEIDPPKHFRIVIKDKELDKTDSIHISKRCQVKEGLLNSETTVTRTTYIDAKTNKKSYTYSQFLPKETYCD